MSSPTTPAAPGSGSGSATPTATPSRSDSDTASLYLFTFLATILILVLLSASLVLRSYVLRRRYRQRFQQALSGGLFADLDHTVFNAPGPFDPLLAFRSPARRLGPSPVLWDTWILPADRDDTLSSITPVAVRCNPFPSSSSSLASPGSPSSPPVSPRPSRPTPRHSQSPFVLSPRISSPQSPSLASTPASPDPNTTAEKDAATLGVCVLVAMPAPSSPVHRAAPDAKGKGVDPLECQAHPHGGDADPLLPASLHRSGMRVPDSAEDEQGLPLLEFGVTEMKAGDWVWST